jgi:hypothetical protein
MADTPNPCGFALVAMLGLLGLRIFEATSAAITHVGEEYGPQERQALSHGWISRNDPAGGAVTPWAVRLHKDKARAS